MSPGLCYDDVHVHSRLHARLDRRGVQMKIQSDSSAQLVNEDDSDLGVASRLAPDEAEEAP